MFKLSNLFKRFMKSEPVIKEVDYLQISLPTNNAKDFSVIYKYAKFNREDNKIYFIALPTLKGQRIEGYDLILSYTGNSLVDYYYYFISDFNNQLTKYFTPEELDNLK